MDLPRERLDRHARDAHGVGMRSKKDPGLAGTVGRKPRHHIRTTWQNLAEPGVRACGGEKFRQPFRAGRLAGLRRSRIPVRVDARDADQFAGYVSDSHRFKYHSINFGMPSAIFVCGL